MSGLRLDDSAWLLTRTRGPARATRLIIALAPLLATLCTSLAAGRPYLLSSAIIVVLGAIAAVAPDTHLGLVVIVALAAEWMLRVPDSLSAWLIAIAALIGVFHLALTFAATAPAGAALGRDLCLRWVQRGLVLAAAPALVWASAVVLRRVELGAQSVLVTGALVAVSAVGVWGASAQRS